MEVKALPAEHRRYTYTPVKEICEKTGLIGLQQGDFIGYEFETTWWTDSLDGARTTREFLSELERVVKKLREEGFLESRSALHKFMKEHQEACWKGSYTEMAAVRVDTSKYAFLIRMVPTGDYNTYIYCYLKDKLDAHLADAAKGIRFVHPDCEVRFRIADGDTVRLAYADGTTKDYMAQYVDDYHLVFGGKTYHICELAEHLYRNGVKSIFPLRSSLPERCYAVLPETWEIVALVKGAVSFCKTSYTPSSREEAAHIKDILNSGSGISKAQEAAMIAGAMFGWASVAADPSNYDENGNLAVPITWTAPPATV